MPTEKTILLYTYEELSDRAKEAARQWWRECRDESDYEPVVEDFIEVATRIGVTFKTHEVRLMSGKTRQDPCIWWQLGYVQSDYASFDGHYNYRPGCAGALKAYAPQDHALHTIVDSLKAVQRRYGYRLTATISNHHNYGQQVECFVEDSDREVSEDDYRAVQEAFRNLSNWLYCQLEKQDQYLEEEETIADAMDANGYTFTEDGRRED